MNLRQFDEDTKKLIRALSASGIVIVSLFLLANHISDVWGIVIKVISAMSPFIIGLILMFIMEPVRNLAEQQLSARTSLSAKTIRRISAVICLVLLLFLICGFFAVLIPQLADSLRTLIDSIDGYIRTIRNYIQHFETSPEIAEFLEASLDAMGRKLSTWLTGAEGGLSQILSFSISFARAIMDFFVGVIIALYLLLDEEKFKRQIKAVMYSSLPREAADETLSIMRLTIRTFDSFVFGKSVDSLIIAGICYISCFLMKMPYAPLIAFAIGITNMIPVFGPFIGAVPCILILLIISPLKALEFSIFIIILQQIDGNIIGPKILGDAVGLPTMWVMFAIICGGALFGVPGMFAGVPIFSVIYVLVKSWAIKQLKQKNINIDEV